MSSEIERVQRLYDRDAEGYDRGMVSFERWFIPDGRAWVCSRARGETLEIAAGTGRNLPFYPADVRLTGLDVSPAMLAVARQRAKELGRQADLRVGDAQALDFPAASFDTVVCTLALCTIPDPARAVAEAARVLRPGGQLLLLEHVRSPILPVRAVEYLLEPLSARFASDHLTREPLTYVAAAGLRVERLERSRWGIIERLQARKPMPA
jgi:ubiquinone/menaquinone biosynthesis C-methylase UbiE